MPSHAKRTDKLAPTPDQRSVTVARTTRKMRTASAMGRATGVDNESGDNREALRTKAWIWWWSLTRGHTPLPRIAPGQRACTGQRGATHSILQVCAGTRISPPLSRRCPRTWLVAEIRPECRLPSQPGALSCRRSPSTKSNSPNAGESVPRPYSVGVPRVEAPGTSSFRSGSATPSTRSWLLRTGRSTSRPRNGALPAILSMRNWCRQERLRRPSTCRCTCSRIPRFVSLWECPSSMSGSWCASTSTR